MKNKVLNFFGFVAFMASFSSCSPPQSTSNAGAPTKGILQGIIGGKTESQSSASGPHDKKLFDAIASHMVMVGLEEVKADGTKKIVELGSGVILNESFILTSAHYFENYHFDSNHFGAIFIGSSGRWQERQKFVFSKSDILNRTAQQVDDLSRKGWSTEPGNKDYVLIKINGELPKTYSSIRMITDISFFKKGDPYYAAGFGYSENKRYDYQLRVAKLTLSRSSSSQTSEKYASIPSILGVEDRNYFLEFNASGALGILPSDSGGAFFYENTDASGNVEVYLAGIVTGYAKFGPALDCENELASCVAADYGLRVDAFHDDAIRTAKRLSAGQM